MPLSWLPEMPGRAAWYAFNLLLLVLVVLRIAQWRGLPPLSPRWSLLLLTALTFGPAVQTLYLAQINFVILALLLEATIRLSRGREATGGALLGLAAGIKVFPAAVAVGLATLLIPLVLVGSEPYRHFFADQFSSQLGKLPGIPINQSLYAVFAAQRSTIGDPDWFVLAVAASGVLALATLFVARRYWASKQIDADEIGLLVLLLLLAMPISWIHYQVLLLPIFATLLFAHGTTERFPRLGTVMAVVAAYALPTIQIVAWKWLAVMPFASILLFLGCYGLVVLWAYLAIEIRRGGTATARKRLDPRLLAS